MFGGGYLYRGYQVFFSVCAQHADGELAAGQNHRFAQVLQHKAECGGCICHCIRAMQNDESIKVIVIVFDDFYQFCP